MLVGVGADAGGVDDIALHVTRRVDRAEVRSDVVGPKGPLVAEILRAVRPPGSAPERPVVVGHTQAGHGPAEVVAVGVRTVLVVIDVAGRRIDRVGPGVDVAVAVAVEIAVPAVRRQRIAAVVARVVLVGLAVAVVVDAVADLHFRHAGRGGVGRVDRVVAAVGAVRRRPRAAGGEGGENEGGDEGETGHGGLRNVANPDVFCLSGG